MDIVAKKQLAWRRVDDVRPSAIYRTLEVGPAASVSYADAAAERIKTGARRMTPSTTPSPERVPLALLSSRGNLCPYFRTPRPPVAHGAWERRSFPAPIASPIMRAFFDAMSALSDVPRSKTTERSALRGESAKSCSTSRRTYSASEMPSSVARTRARVCNSELREI